MTRMDRAETPRRPAEPSMRDEILRFVGDTFGRRNWGHTGLVPAIRGLRVEEAVWKPEDSVHSVWEQINHIAHWKRYVLERVQGKRPRSYQAWPPAGRTAAGLRRAVSGLAALDRDLRRVVRDLGHDALRQKKGGRYIVAQLLLGAAAHDSYHTGQILLTRRLYRGRRNSR